MHNSFCPQRLAQRMSTRANASCGLAILAVGVHPVPYRTRKLSPHAPMVLQGQPCGRVGRRHPTSRIGSFFVCQRGLGHSPAATTTSSAYEYARLSVRLRNRDLSLPYASRISPGTDNSPRLLYNHALVFNIHFNEIIFLPTGILSNNIHLST